jgi:long-chain acyl-CoA synthetase
LSTTLVSALQDCQTLPDLLRDSVKHFSDRPLFGEKDGGRWHWYRYATFASLVDRTREGFKTFGLNRGDRIAIIAPNSLDFAICAYAAFEIGAAIVALYENQSDTNWEYIIRDCGAKAVFVSSMDICERVSRIRTKLPGVSILRLIATVVAMPSDAWREDDALESFIVHEPRVTAGDLATIIYTSGTTGEPKGVPLTHGNICANVNTIRKLFPLGTRDRSMAFLPWAHIFGQVLEMHTMISLGASIAICEGTDMIVANLAEVRPTVLFSVPRIYDKIHAAVNKQLASKRPIIRRLFDAGVRIASKRAAGFDPTVIEYFILIAADRLLFAKIRNKFGGRLRFAMSGGASLAKEVGTFIDALGIAVYEAYGLTETGCVSANTPGHRKMGGVGRPIDEVRVTLDTSVTDDPSQGEIIVTGPSVMSGYLNRPDSTKEAIMSGGSFRTGDLGRFDSEGYLFITGRIKDQYKLANGKYMAPAPLEDRIKLSPLIANAMIYGDNRLHNVALIVPEMAAFVDWAINAGLSGSPQELLARPDVHALFAAEIEKYSADVPKYEKVKEFALIEEDFTQENGMLTPTFKLRRRNVMQRWGTVIDKLYA